ncbi:MAG: RrF2 family transcriptional regulator [Gemmataceae bacterium]
MKITAQEEYGLRCLLHLARVGEGQALTIPEIAESEKLSPPYVAKLLSVLRQAGLITSVRGRTGGYLLSRPAAETSLGEVMRVLGEPLFDDPGYCVSHSSPDSDGACVHSDGCTLRVVWQTLEQWLRHLLDRVTLADLLQTQEQIAQHLHAQLHSEMLDLPSGLLTLGSAARD